MMCPIGSFTCDKLRWHALETSLHARKWDAVSFRCSRPIGYFFICPQTACVHSWFWFFTENKSFEVKRKHQDDALLHCCCCEWPLVCDVVMQALHEGKAMRACIGKQKREREWERKYEYRITGCGLLDPSHHYSSRKSPLCLFLW